MDATQLKKQVQDLTSALVTSDHKVHNDAIQAKFASDAILESPNYKAQGADAVKDVVGLHTSFSTNDSVGDVDWDEAKKTARFSLKSKYGLPFGDLPWPISLCSLVTVDVHWDNVTLQLAPDKNVPVQSEATDASKYHVTKVSVPAPRPRNRVIAAAVHVVLFAVRLISPYIINVLVVVMKFFQRNPYKERGLFRTGFAAAHDVVAYILSIIQSFLPFLGGKQAVKPQHSIDNAAPTTDSAPDSPVTSGFTAKLPRSLPLKAKPAEPKHQKAELKHQKADENIPAKELVEETGTEWPTPEQVKEVEHPEAKKESSKAELDAAPKPQDEMLPPAAKTSKPHPDTERAAAAHIPAKELEQETGTEWPTPEQVKEAVEGTEVTPTPAAPEPTSFAAAVKEDVTPVPKSKSPAPGMPSFAKAAAPEVSTVSTTADLPSHDASSATTGSSRAPTPPQSKPAPGGGAKKKSKKNKKKN